MMLSKWFNTAKDEQLCKDLPEMGHRDNLSEFFKPNQSAMHYYFSAFNPQILMQETLYQAEDVTDFIHQSALVCTNLGELPDAVFQLLESDAKLSVIYQLADYDNPLREHLQIAGVYHAAAVKAIVAAFEQTHLPLVIAHFTDDTVLADELLTLLSQVQRVFEFAKQENKIVLSYLA